ncbi:myotubularin-related protein 3 isoform X2 [Anoplophora glabripennis]|uniref:myotubularin-related protein 3 isoform X2 n=1 Tax=Anoplophora glabripennis TaxID=217634 RepID=UPI00087374EB|nr:myotubularin-related protein 3 isoform X2 [Anoplophora glabripennis]
MVNTETMDNTDQPNSLYHVDPICMYPLQSTDTKNLPFGLLTGENKVHCGKSVDGAILITNYRLYLQNGKNHYHIPLGLIEVVEPRELFYLHIGCKDARTYKCTFENNEECLEWYNRIVKAAEPSRDIKQLFAFYHFFWSKQKDYDEVIRRLENQRRYTFDKEMFANEMIRLQFEGDSWRISKVNENYKLCPTYPPYLLVPSCINDDVLENVAKFRSSRRIPAAVWRHTRNGAVIARCSQPEVGWLGWRSDHDEELIKAISAACNFDRSQRANFEKESNLSHSPGSLHSDDSLQFTNEINQTEKKVLIMDARSYTTAVANRARGGGCECPEYYPNCEIQFMNLANIHSIRKSFHALRQLCTSSADQPNWFSQLEGTRWLQHMSGLMKAALTLVTAVERDERPVLVHCSDGWDRTPQIVALAELLLDPYYRTIDGFRILIEREWLAFGHKFADRCGHSSGSDDQNERCPVFLQWLDCIHQVQAQYPCAFEFSPTYLVKLAQHIYSNLFGTFLCNTLQERLSTVNDKTFSVWDFLNSPCFRNHLYAPLTITSSRKVLWPQCNVRELKLWSEVYLGSMEINFNTEVGPSWYPGPPELSPRHMTKTRSYGDLKNVGDFCQNQYRRCSDPSINCDSKLTVLAPDIPQHDPNMSPNGHHDHTAQPDFYPSDLEDVDCKQDCLMFKDAVVTETLTDEQIDGLDQCDFSRHLPSARSDVDVGVGRRVGDSADFLGENVIKRETERINSDVGGLSLNGACQKAVQNGDYIRNDDSDEVSGHVEGRAVECEVGLDGRVSGEVDGTSCGTVGAFLDERSVETSTETLVSEHMCSSSPKEINGFEKVQSPIESSDMTDGCAQKFKFSQGAHSRQHSVGDQRSRCSGSPYSNGWDATFQGASQKNNLNSYQYTLGDDGLIPLRCVVQERLDQIIDEHKRKVDLLEKELHVTRQNLIKQSCQRCNHMDGERQDDNSSVVESICSASEGQASAGESQRSDMSWVAIEEASLADCQTLWVPDHAVSRCTGCGTEFWLGRRRHHCRKCGKIFCADCSENSTPLPSEQLYNPVRVCTGCYSQLRRDCPEIPNQCKHTNTQTTNTNPQIAASSN